MEEQTILKEILSAVKLHGEHMEQKMDNMKIELENKISSLDNKVSSLENKMDRGFERLEKKFNCFRIEFTESQETIDYLSRKVGQPRIKSASFKIN